ncbi:Holliday junction resolvase RuvX [bacterium]|nr:Holliday junction resolvase RuvX [bacterium]
MRLLGIDYGTKHVGLAISDEGGALAFPLVVLPTTKKLTLEVARICEEKEISEIVIGESRDYAGKENPVQKKILEFKKELEEEMKLPVHFEPEFWTSVQARKMGGSGNHNDASAAALILQAWVDRKMLVVYI